MSKVRGVRFSSEEQEKIDEFLNKNPLFDFSTLARTAILSFLETPRIEIVSLAKAGKQAKRTPSRNARGIQ